MRGWTPASAGVCVGDEPFVASSRANHLRELESGAAAPGAAGRGSLELGVAFGLRGLRFDGGFLFRAYPLDQDSDLLDLDLAAAVGEDTVMADLHKAKRQRVQAEAAKKLRHYLIISLSLFLLSGVKPTDTCGSTLNSRQKKAYPRKDRLESLIASRKSSSNPKLIWRNGGENRRVQ